MRSRIVFVIIAALCLCVAAVGERSDEVKSIDSDKVSQYKVLNKAGIPQLVNYQGYLVDAEGNPVTDTLEMTFSIWDASTGGSQLWSETQTSVPVVNGLFDVLLGSVTPIPSSIFTAPSRWLQTEIAGQELSPRRQFASVGYAFRADTADYAIAASADDDWTIDGDDVYHEAGNVGIGTASPDLKLHVYGGPGSKALLVIGEGISGGERGLDIGYHYDGDYSYFQSAHQGTGFTPIAFNPEGGNVGIGTTIPISKLEVDLDKQFELSPTGDGFGIGIALPGAGTQGNGNYGPGLFFSKINSGRRMGAISSVQTSSDADQGGLAFFVHSASSSNDILVERMRIDHSGNVGIGTASPTNLLELSSSAPKLYFNRENSTSNLSGLYWRNTDDDFEGAFVRNNSTGNIELYTNVTGETPRMLITDAGNVGIGTTGPAAKLDVRGDLYVTGTYRGNIASSSGSDGAPFPRPAYDSGWQWVGQGGTITLNHNIGGDVANYFVDLWFKDTGTGQIHNDGYGGSDYGGGFNEFRGAYWLDLTNAHIKVLRGTDDDDCNYVRVRIWVYN